ncbi:tetratricopeptide repeat protein, partial [Candidatus Riflebacteria bacterium]
LSTPPVWLANFTSPKRAANIPEFVNLKPDAIKNIKEEFVNSFSITRAALSQLHYKDKVAGERSFRKALKMNPDDTEALQKYGFFLDREGRIDEAEVYLKRSIDAEPKNAFSHLVMANIMAQRGEFLKAVEYNKTALAIASSPHELDLISRAGVHYNLGYIYANIGKFLAAEENVRKAISIFPELAVAHKELGKLLARRGDFFQARYHFEQALRFAPNDFSAKVLLNRIKRHPIFRGTKGRKH